MKKIGKKLGIMIVDKGEKKWGGKRKEKDDIGNIVKIKKEKKDRINIEEKKWIEIGSKKIERLIDEGNVNFNKDIVI